MRHSTPALVALVPALVPLLTGCDARPGEGWAGTVDTTATGVVEVGNPASGRWSPDDAWRVEEVSRVGTVDGEGPEQFGRIAFASIDPLGRSWVYDAQADELRVFTREGAWVRNVGRAGEGPGEFANPSGMAWDPDGRAWVMDPRAVRMSVFDTAGTFVTSYRILGGTQRFPWPGTVDGEGRVWDQVGGLEQSWLVRFGPELATADSFPVPTDPRADDRSVTVTTASARMTMGIPFAGSHVWRLAPGEGLWTLLSEDYLLSRLDLSGDTLRRVWVEHDRIPVTAEERAEAVERWSGAAGELDAALVPDTKPPTGSFVVDDTGHLWVSRTLPVEGTAWGATDFDVLTPEGILLGRVQLPWPVSTFGLVVRGGELVATTRDDLGVEYVVRGRVLRGR